jgi:hypothetical protein
MNWKPFRGFSASSLRLRPPASAVRCQFNESVSAEKFSDIFYSMYK